MLPNILLLVTLEACKLINFRYFLNVRSTLKHYAGKKIMLHVPTDKYKASPVLYLAKLLKCLLSLPLTQAI